MLLMSSKEISSYARPALFLDRDGVINKDYGYVHSVDDFEFMPGIFDLVRSAKQKGYICIVVTNQAGIGREFYSLDQFYDLSKWMCDKFKATGGLIDAIYYSPFHPTDAKGEFLRQEDTRKPGPGMFYEAFNDFPINISDSIMVGDRISDMLAGLSAQISKNYLFLGSTHAYTEDIIDSKITTIKKFTEINL